MSVYLGLTPGRCHGASRVATIGCVSEVYI